MATNPSRLTVAGLVRVWLAAVGTPVPVGLADPIAPWSDVGLTTPDSLKFTTKPEFDDVESHQSAYPTRIIQKKDDVTIEVDLQEWSATNFTASFGGGTIVPVVGTPTLFRYAPPALGNRSEIASLIDVFDGPKRYRFITPRSMQRDGANLELKKTPEARLPLRLSVLGGADVDPWYLVTNDPAFAPTP